MKEFIDWIMVIAFSRRCRRCRRTIVPHLALSTYKSEMPALRKAKEILMPLAPATSSDVEMVGLWGAVHKRLWEKGKKKAGLDQAIRAYERGHLFKNDQYNDINFAFLLDVVLKGLLP